MLLVITGPAYPGVNELVVQLRLEQAQNGQVIVYATLINPVFPDFWFDYARAIIDPPHGSDQEKVRMYWDQPQCRHGCHLTSGDSMDIVLKSARPLSYIQRLGQEGPPYFRLILMNLDIEMAYFEIPLMDADLEDMPLDMD